MVLMYIPVSYTHLDVYKRQVLGLSGGVDSSVAAVLLHRAIGKNLYCIFVDSGLLESGLVVHHLLANFIKYLFIQSLM